jgi:hypothetical protein
VVRLILKIIYETKCGKMSTNNQPINWPRALQMHRAWQKNITYTAIAENEGVSIDEVKKIVRWVAAILKESKPHQLNRLQPKTVADAPKPPMVRPPAVYSNSTPYGIAKTF